MDGFMVAFCINAQLCSFITYANVPKINKKLFRIFQSLDCSRYV